MFDADRLATVAASGLLRNGPAPEPEFDRYSRLAAALTGAPIARLSVVDDAGQHFKSAVGPLPASGRGTPLAHAICKHVVGDRAALVISDTAADPRVADSGAVTEDRTGAYLGVPVRWPDGHVLGAFCVADERRHAWTKADRAALEDLAAAVDTELALRAALADARGRACRGLRLRCPPCRRRGMAA